MTDLAWVFMERIKSMLTLLDKIPPKITHTPRILNPEGILSKTVVTFGWV